MLKKLAVAAMSFACAFLPTSPALAQYTMNTGNEALAMCRPSADSSDQLVCAAWVNGAQEGMVTMQIVTNQRFFCFPTGSTVGQYIDVFVAYLQAHPADRHNPSGALLLIALREAFPCPSA